MTQTVTGSPVGPLANAIFVALKGDANLVALATGGIYDALPRGARVAHPYVIVGEREGLPGRGAMQIEGTEAGVTVHVWSDARGHEETHTILSRIRVILQRANLPVTGFTLIQGSLRCELEQAFPDIDPDMPEESLHHGVQRWRADLEEVL